MGDVSPAAAPTVIGRDGEIAQIDAFLERAHAGSRVLVMEGPAGIGKSSLWQHAVGVARARGFATFASRPAEGERGLANVVLGDLFGDVPDEVLDVLPPPRRRAFDAALLRREDTALRLDPRALGVALVTLLRALAGDGPVLLAVDDDQWMDASSGATLAFAMRRLEEHRVSLLLSRRALMRPPVELEEAVPGNAVERLEVGPLSVGAVSAVIRDRLGTVLSRPAQVRLHEASGGNAFYALELARTQASEGRKPGGARARAALTVPPTLERLVHDRIRSVDAGRELLLLVAAQGRLPIDALDALSITEAALDSATQAGVLEVVNSTVRFTHPLLASSIYQAATRAEQQAAHRQLATVVDDPLHRARHLGLAADGPDADVATTLETAASLARDRGLPIAAAELAEQTLRRTPPDDEEAWRSRAAAAARSYAAAGDRTAGQAIAAELLARSPAGLLHAEALLVGSELQPLTTSIAMLEEALAEAESSPRLMATIHARLADDGYFVVEDRVAFVDRHATASLRLAEDLDDDGLRARALVTLAYDRLARGRAGPLQLVERAYRLAERGADPALLARAAVAVGHVLTWTGPVTQAREWLEMRLADWANRDETTREHLLWYLAIVEIWAGRWALANDHAAESLATVQQYGIESVFDYFPSAFVALHLGDLDMARALSEKGLALAGASQGRVSYLAILGACDAWTGAPDAAVVRFEQATAAAAAVEYADPSMHHWTANYAEALLQLGRIDEAAELVTRWEAQARRLDRPRQVAAAIRCRGQIAAARGNLGEAIELLESSVVELAAVEDPFGRARALLALGTARRRDRQKRTAREALEAALDAFETLGARTWTVAARSELARIGGRSRIEGLSPSERSVATLVAEGRTNREIASALYLGERTVASHLTHIYAKLGVRSRTELAHHLAGKVPTS